MSSVCWVMLNRIVCYIATGLCQDFLFCLHYTPRQGRWSIRFQDWRDKMSDANAPWKQITLIRSRNKFVVRCIYFVSPPSPPSHHPPSVLMFPGSKFVVREYLFVHNSYNLGYNIKRKYLFLNLRGIIIWINC